MKFYCMLKKQGVVRLVILLKGNSCRLLAAFSFDAITQHKSDESADTRRASRASVQQFLGQSILQAQVDSVTDLEPFASPRQIFLRGTF